MENVIVLASGGINSAVAAARTCRESPPYLLHADYGQPAAPAQRSAVQALAGALDVKDTLAVDLPHVRDTLPTERDASSALAGHLPGVMPLILSAAAQWAAQLGASTLVCGASQVADEAEHQSPPERGTPDHRHVFFRYFQEALTTAWGSQGPFSIQAPFAELTREEIVRLGDRFDVPWEHTYPCTRNGQRVCGECDSCQAVIEAFAAATVQAPWLPAPGEAAASP